MRGQPERQLTMVTFDDLNLESRTPATHPLRLIETLTDAALAAISPRNSTASTQPYNWNAKDVKELIS